MYKDTQTGPKRGVSLFSYWGEYGVSMDLENCFQDMYDMGAHGLEILANSHIPCYPELTDEWVEQWFKLLDKYEIVPVEYGHWIDSRLYAGRDLTNEEALQELLRDFKIANRLGFPILRTKMGVIDDVNAPQKNWPEIVKMALPYAEQYNVRMCPEIHQPSALKGKFVQDYVEFMEKYNTEYFGLNVDFGGFQNVFAPGAYVMPGMPEDGSPCSYPEDMIPLMKHIYCCHAKFYHMDDNFEETTIPYPQILKVLKENGYNGYMVSELEVPSNTQFGLASDQIRRQHIMMKRILGY
jgi:sugar phosphate isomerase/epimerase